MNDLRKLTNLKQQIGAGKKKAIELEQFELAVLIREQEKMIQKQIKPLVKSAKKVSSLFYIHFDD